MNGSRMGLPGKCSHSAAFLLTHLFQVTFIALNAQEIEVPLNAGWIFSQAGSKVWYPAKVPGLVHTDLMRNGSLPDPYQNVNMDSVQWVENEDWNYQLTFEPDNDLLHHEHVDLVFKGLDTFAEVELNGTPIGSANNMFRTWRWPVKHLLLPGSNVLTVRFESPIRRGRELRDSYGMQLPHDSDPSGVAPYVRKAAYHFGWDFAPRLVSMGIWQEVQLNGWSHHHISDLSVQQVHEAGNVSVSVSVGIHPEVTRIDTSSRSPLRLLTFLDDELVATSSFEREGVGISEIHFQVKDADRWWPDGEGDQPVHDLRVELWSDKLLSSKNKRVGWREVILDQHVDSIGMAYAFVINDRPVFMKGCNLVPPDMFLPRAGDSAWVSLVTHMAASNMNMVRVWGGGVYPPDAFFDACDTAGIMVWQDLMFAYPSPYDPSTRKNIRAEVTDQLDRFGSHPCMAVICGNNELEVAWHNWGWQKRYGMSAVDSARVWNDQQELFHGAEIRGLVENEHGLSYVATSPLSNWGNDRGLRHGSLHYWGVWHADSAFTSYHGNVGRFMSEYGFQSWPDSAMLARYVDPLELYIGSAVLQKRQGSYRGEAPIQLAMNRELGGIPSSFAEYCTTSQMLQAMAASHAITAHLRKEPVCMGTLIWQLNDVWPAPSWSLIDHDGNRKPAFFRVQELYAPTLK